MSFTHVLLSTLLSGIPLLQFSVDTIELQKNDSTENHLEGEMAARQFLLKTSQGQIELSPRNGGLAVADVSLEGSDLSIRQGDLLLTSTLPGEDILKGISSFRLQRADLQMNSKKILGKLEKASATYQSQSYQFDNVALQCQTDGSFDFEIIGSCLNSGELTPRQDAKAKLKMTAPPQVQEMILDFSKLHFDDKNFTFASRGAEVLFTKNEYLNVGKGNINCLKKGDFDELDPQAFLDSCFYSSGGHLAWLDYKAGKTLYSADGLEYTLNPKRLAFRAKKGESLQQSVNGEQSTRLRGLSLNCSRSPNKNSLELDLLADCLDSAKLNVDSVEREENFPGHSPRGSGEAGFDGVKDFTIHAKNRDITMRGKTTTLPPLPFTIKGPTSLDKKKHKLHFTIKEASVFGLPARTLVVYLLESVILPSRIHVDGRHITIDLSLPVQI